MLVSEPISDDEIVELNRRAVERTSIIARYAGAALVAVGALGAIGWSWLAARAQLEYGPVGFGFVGSFDAPTPSVVQRVDLFANGLDGLMLSSVAVGLGVLLRLAGDYAQTRVGGSITGYRAGDAFDDDVEVAT